MLQRLFLATTAAVAISATALAQQVPPASKAPGAQPGATSAGQFINQQGSDQWLASKFNGTDVIGANNEKIGDVNDILFDRNGRIVAYVVGVGGFLGIGAKDVALAPTAFQVHMDRDEMKLRLGMTRDELRNAPEFRAATARTAPTTGQAPGSDRTAPPKAPAR